MTYPVTHQIHQLLLDRWSPRSFDGSVISQEELEVMLAAAGTAPSAFNHQPWRFLYAHRNDGNWDRFLSLLIPFNAGWAQHASVLVFVLSDTQHDGQPIYSHSFDAGAAWAHLALQATAMGFHTHGMTGLDFEKARRELTVPERFRIEAAVAIGRRGAPERLPPALRERETPSDRKPLAEIVFAGNFPPAS